MEMGWSCHLCTCTHTKFRRWTRTTLPLPTTTATRMTTATQKHVFIQYSMSSYRKRIRFKQSQKRIFVYFNIVLAIRVEDYTIKYTPKEREELCMTRSSKSDPSFNSKAQSLFHRRRVHCHGLQTLWPCSCSCGHRQCLQWSPVNDIYQARRAYRQLRHRIDGYHVCWW